MEHKKHDFSNFKLRVIRHGGRAPVNDRSYNRYGYRDGTSVRNDFTLEKINEIIRSGDIASARDLSLYYYRTNSDYKNNIDLLASLFLYDSVVIPVMKGKGSKTQMINNFDEACAFIEALDLPNLLTHITKQWLKVGIYYGLLRVEGDVAVVQDLPIEYCRVRFKDFHNLNILEFNLNYFNSIYDEEYRLEVVESFPKLIQDAWKSYSILKVIKDPWIAIPFSEGGVCFTFSDDPVPALLASIPELKKMEDAISREETRDENELYKLLIQKMPVDKDGELVFQLDEIAAIHSSVADMLQDMDTVDVLTTLGDAELENLQDSTAAAQSNNRIEKYRQNAFDALGRSSIIFNADGSSTLAYSIKKDEALMITYINQYEAWIRMLLNDKFSRNGITFDFEILPITVFNRQDQQNAYFRGAQYGYSKMFAGVSMGIKQRDQISLMKFENEFLKMSEQMIPLQSSYTTSGSTISNEENKNSGKNNINSSQGNDLNNKGGRPELPDEEKSEKTQANIKAAG